MSGSKEFGIAAGYILAGGQTVAAAPTLQTLSLSTTSFTAGTLSTFNIIGATAGSTITLSSSDGTPITVTGTSASWTPVAGTPSITPTETLAGATNSPHVSPAIPVTVSAASSAMLMGSRYNQMGFNGYAGSDGTDTNSNSRIGSYNETGATVTKLRAYFPNWYATNTNETNGFNAITVTAAVEYPAGTITPLLFSGSASAVIPASGASLAESDEATLTTPIPTGALYWIRTYVLVTAGQKWPQGYLIAAITSSSLSEAADFSTGVDKTQSGTITNATASATRRGYGPAGVKATAFTGTPVTKAFAAVGDSIVMGSTDLADPATTGHGNVGYFAKACATNYPVVNLGIAGTQASVNLPANFTRRQALLDKLGITHIFCDWSVNDVAAGQTAAQIAANVSSIAAGFKSAIPGVKVDWPTCTPKSSSTDAFKTATNQTPFATPTGAFTGGAASVRSQFNVLLRAGISGVDTVFEAANTIEVNSLGAFAQDGGLWVAGMALTHQTNTGATTDAATGDGLHPIVVSSSAPQYGGIYILRDAVRAVFAGW